MSGTFVEMLRRIVDMSGYTSTPGAGVAGEAERRNRGAAAHARRLRRVRPAALDRQADAGRLSRPRARAEHPPGLLRPGGRSDRRQHAGRRRPHRAARHLGLRARRASYTNAEPRDLRGILLSSALALFLIDAVIVALLGARPCRAAAARARRRRALALRADPRRARRSRPSPHARRRQRRFRHQVGLADAPRLCRHRQCRRRFHRQGRHVRADAVPRPAHRAGSRRSRRRRSRARRTGVLPADLLAGGAGRAKAAAGRASTASTPT